MNRESHISSLVVHVRPDYRDIVAADLAHVQGAEVHAADATGKIVVTLESEDMDSVQSFMSHLADLPGVLSSNLVYHHCEDAEALAEEIEYENHPT